MRIQPMIWGTVLLAGGACAQTPDPTLTFEVASVKPATPPAPGSFVRFGGSGGPGSKDPERYTVNSMSLMNLLITAYDLKPYQITGPAFLNTERYEITAKVPAGATKEQFRVMLQNLLAERFKMVVHREKKEMQVYELTVMKNGPKFKESVPAPPAATPTPPPDTPPMPMVPSRLKLDADGFPEIPAGAGNGTSMIMMNGRARMRARNQSMPDLANMLSNQVGKPVTDATGLTAKYDFTLTFTGGSMGMPGMPMIGVVGPPPPPPPPGAGGGGGAPNPTSTDDSPGLTIFGAVQEQLGLRLDQKKGMVDMLIVDRAEKVPTEN